MGTVRCPFPRKGKGGAATKAQASIRGRSVKALAWCAVYISFSRPNRPRWRGNISAGRFFGRGPHASLLERMSLGQEVIVEAKLAANDQPNSLPSQSGISKFLSLPLLPSCSFRPEKKDCKCRYFVRHVTCTIQDGTWFEAPRPAPCAPPPLQPSLPVHWRFRLRHGRVNLEPDPTCATTRRCPQRPPGESWGGTGWC